MRTEKRTAPKWPMIVGAGLGAGAGSVLCDVIGLGSDRWLMRSAAMMAVVLASMYGARLLHAVTR